MDDFSQAQAPALSRRWQGAAWMKSLQVRLALGLLVAVGSSVGLSVHWLLQAAERDTLQRARDRVLAESVQAARLIDLRVREAQRMLASVAEDTALTEARLPSTPELRAFLKTKQALRSQFDGVYVTDAAGQILMLWDAQGPRAVNASVADRPYFRQAMGEGRPAVSGVVLGRVNPEPLVVLAQPVLRAGKPVAVLCGALEILRRDLVAAVSEAPSDPATDQTQVVVTDEQGVIMGHAERAMVGRPLLQDPRWAPVVQRWLRAGSPNEPTGAEFQGEDLRVVASVAGMPNSGWLAWTLQEEQKALAPLAAMRSRAMLAGASIGCAVALLSLFWLRYQLRPLHRLRVRAARLFEAGADVHTGWPGSAGEIGELERVLRHVGAEQAQLTAFNEDTMRRLQSLMAAAPVGLCFTRGGRFELVSAEMARMLGRHVGEMVGSPAQDAYASEDEYRALGPRVAAAFAAGQRFDGELQFRRADGSTFVGRLQGMPVSAGAPAAGTIWSLMDVTREVRQRANLEWSASHDVLTGLANRTALEAAIESALSAEASGVPGRAPAALVLFDLDRFKPINDSHGHAAGDAVLKAVASTLQGRLRKGDLAVRLGGDEFVVLLPNCPPEPGLRVAEDLRSAISELRVAWHGELLQVGVSLGVAPLTPTLQSGSDWLASADQACYAAKGAGRNRVALAPASEPGHAHLRPVATEA